MSATAADRRPLSSRPFVPVGVTSRYAPPRATIDPDRSKSWIGRARPIVMSHKRTLLTALSLSFVALMLQVQIPNLLNEAVTNSLQRHTVPLSYYVTLVLALAVPAGISAYISRLFLLRTAYAMEFDLRNIIYEHLTRMSFGFYDRVQSGQLISRANSDIRSVQTYLTFAPSILVQCAVALVAFGYMLSINVPLAFVAMSTTPLVYFSSVRMRRQIFPVSWLIQSRLADVATIVDENINGVRVVKSFVAEPRELSTLAKAADRLKWAYIQDADIRARFTPTVQNLPQLGLALVLLFGGWLVIHGDLQVGAILAFSAYIVMLQAPFQLLGMLIMLGQRAKASAGRIYEILDEAPAIVDRPDAIELVDCEGDVRFDEVDFAYANGPQVLSGLSLHLKPGETVAMVGRTASGKTTISRLLPRFDHVTFGYDPAVPVVSDIDLRIRAGETVAFVGQTGAGKSTLAKLITRFYDPTEGRVLIDGRDIRHVTVDSLRRQLGVVPQEPFLFAGSLRYNVAFACPDASDEEIWEAVHAVGLGDVVKRMPEGLDTIVHERGQSLSSGERQLLALARAFLAHPRVLVLDEATSNLDLASETKIEAALDVLLQARTAVLIAHRLTTAMKADRIVVIDDGRIVEVGSHDELVARGGRYAGMYATWISHAETQAA